MPKHQMILSERQIAALADACNIDVRHIEKHADEEFGNQLDAFAQAVAEDVIKQTIALFDYDESMSSTSESIANYVALGRIRAHFKVGDML